MDIQLDIRLDIQLEMVLMAHSNFLVLWYHIMDDYLFH